MVMSYNQSIKSAPKMGTFRKRKVRGVQAELSGISPTISEQIDYFQTKLTRFSNIQTNKQTNKKKTDNLKVQRLYREYVYSVAVFQKYLTRLGELIIFEPLRENYHFSKPSWIF